jgi:hypothetical protein
VTVVVVGGPPMAGVTSLAAALRERLPDVDVVEGTSGQGAAVAVLAVSAVAPPTASDLAVLDTVAGSAGRVLGAVTKVDAHRCWRDVRDQLAERYPGVTWTGTAAAPHLGAPDVAEAVAAVRALLASSPGGGRVGELRSCRSALVRAHRTARAGGAAALRTGLHRERLALGRYTRERIAALRTEYRAVAAELPRRGSVEQRLRTAADDLLADVYARADRRLADLADALGAPAPNAAPRPIAPDWGGQAVVSRRAERGLTLALGVGFGLGIAVAAGRLAAMLAPGWAVAAQAMGALVGLVLTAWLVATRELLHDRAAADRWVCDVTAALRGCADDVVAGRLLDAEVHFGGFLATRATEETEALNRRIAVIDAELRTLRNI